MTEPSIPSAATTSPTASASRWNDPLVYAHVRLDNLNVALEAAKLAVDLAKEGPLHSFSEKTADEILEIWRINILLVHAVFENLYYEGRSVIQAVRETLPPR